MQNRAKSQRFFPVANSEKKENHDGRLQRKLVTNLLPPLNNFDASNFKMRTERCLGSGCFGEVFACSFGFGGKIQCVIKCAKTGGHEDLVLECRILKKLIDEPFDARQKFLPFPYGYSVKMNGLVCDRFYGHSIRQHALQQLSNDWLNRVTELCQALCFIHSRGVLHLDIHSGNVMASTETCKIIDFGKATLIENPITFNLDPEERKNYNARYKQVEFELRNEKQAKTGTCSDIYSLGVLIHFIAKKCLTSDDEKTKLMALHSSCTAPRATRSSLALVISDLQETEI